MKMTIGELIERLQNFSEDAEVRLAIQPGWPFEHGIGQVEIVEGSDECPRCGGAAGDHDPEVGCSDDDMSIDDGVVYIAEDGQLGYLPETAKNVLW